MYNSVVNMYYNSNASVIHDVRPGSYSAVARPKVFFFFFFLFEIPHNYDTCCNTVSYKYKGIRQKEAMNLGEVKVEVGTWELGLDDVSPEPVHRGAVGDVR